MTETVDTSTSGDEYLIFRLGDEEYGVDILRVQEIRGWEAVTRIPNSPDYVKGVLNLRGSIVPIFDLRQRLGMPFRRYTKNTVVIVLRVKDPCCERNVGIVVDEVLDVIAARQASIRATPEFGAGMAAEFISGLVDVAEKMLMLLDVDRLLQQHAQTENEDEDAA